MSEASQCRLCLFACDDSVNLFDGDGQYNVELYNITVKFFDPKFLTNTKDNNLRVMCMDCWRHISEFNQFHEVIVLAQENFLYSTVDIKQNIIKTEAGQSNTKSDSNDILNESIQTKFEVIDSIDNYTISAATSIADNPKALVKNEPIYSISSDEEDLVISSVTSCNGKSINLKTQSVTDNVVANEFSNGNVAVVIENKIISLPKLEFSNDDNDTNIAQTIGSDDKTSKDLSLDNNPSTSASIKYEDVYDISSDDSDQYSETHNTPADVIDEYGDVDQMDIYDSESDSYLEPLDDKMVTYNSDSDEDSANDEKCDRRKKRSSKKRYDAIIAKWKPTLNCSLCNEKFGNFGLLTQHFKHKHVGEKCYAQCCHLKCPNRAYLADHIQIHLNPDIYKCELCGKSYRNERSLRRHALDFHLNYKGVTPKSHQDLDDIISKWKSILECGICSQAQPNFLLLTQHFIIEHTDIKPYIVCCDQKHRGRCDIADHALIHADPASFKCESCGVCCRNSNYLYRHIYRLHRSGRRETSIKRACSICSRVFRDYKKYRKHIKNKHK